MKRSLLLSGLTLCLLLNACHSDDDSSSSVDYNYVNSWIYANMSYYYYWTDYLPDEPSTDQDPDDFYEALLYSGDRFSFMYDNYQELINLLNGVTLESGFEYKLYWESSAKTTVIMQIMYIKPDSPAEDLGLKRGDVIYQINGSTITGDNYSDLISDDMNAAYEATYRRYDSSSDSWVDMGTFDLTPITYAENPVFLDTVYDFNGKKVAYLIYNFFSPGSSSDDTSYDDELATVFSNFKSQGATEFILDLRYNNGGSETSVKTLANLIVQNATSSDLMFTKTYNTTLETYVEDTYGSDYLKTYFSPASGNIGSQLASGNLYAITSSSTASASEVTMNVMRPYMGLYMVGDTTVGKDVGSITIYESDNAENPYAIQPIVVKLVNANDQDYPDGLVPDVYIKDNSLILQPLGDTDETLLAATLSAIGVTTARTEKLSTSSRTLGNPLLDSRNLKKRSGILTMENDLQ